MKKGDIRIIVAIIVLVVTSFIYTTAKGLDQTSRYVVITQNQEILYNIKINDTYSKVLHIEKGDKHNEVHIKNGEVWIEEANCANQVCVYERPISNVGQAIVCLPNKVIVEIKGAKKQELDIISE